MHYMRSSFQAKKALLENLFLSHHCYLFCLFEDKLFDSYLSRLVADRLLSVLRW